MKNEILIDLLNELPNDYDVNFSEYTSVIVDDDNEEEYFIVLDDPIVGLLKNDDTKEIRFFTKSSSERIINQIESGKNWKKFSQLYDTGNVEVLAPLTKKKQNE